MRKVFIENLPRKQGRGREEIDWPNTIGYKVNFIYDDVEDTLEIIDYIKDNKHVVLKYKNNKLSIYVSSFKNAQLGKLLKKVTNEFKIEIGTKIKDDKRDITIIDRKYMNKQRKNGYKESKKWYKYHCNKCHQENWIVEDNINSECGCPVCTNRKIIRGINDVLTTHPWVKDYLVNIEDGYKYSFGSKKKIQMKCPDCGCIKKMSFMNLINKGFGCNKCSDGIKYPNKFMMELLKQLKVEFECEYSPEWIKPKRYDFYIPSKKLIIEMDGGFGHGNESHPNSNYTKEYLINVDSWKDEQAKIHNLKVIRINCDYEGKDRFEHIKKNTIKELINYFDLEKINWLECDKNGCSSMIVKICKFKNEHDDMTLTEISKLFNIHIYTLIRYLKTGNRLGLCHYVPREKKVKSKKSKSVKVKPERKVEMFLNNESIGVFGIDSLIRKSEEMFGEVFHKDSIQRVCNGKRKTYKGYTFKYIT